MFKKQLAVLEAHILDEFILRIWAEYDPKGQFKSKAGLRAVDYP